MQPINKRLENNPTLKSEYEKEGEAFNQKHKTRTETHEKQILDGQEIDFSPNWSEFKPCLEKLRPANETALHYSRCFICEKELNDGFANDVDHYRPKSKKRNRGEAQELQYWWLA